MAWFGALQDNSRAFRLIPESVLLLPAFPNACLTLSLSACLRLKVSHSYIHKAIRVDRRRPAKDNGTGAGSDYCYVRRESI